MIPMNLYLIFLAMTLLVATSINWQFVLGTFLTAMLGILGFAWKVRGDVVKDRREQQLVDEAKAEAHQEEHLQLIKAITGVDHRVVSIEESRVRCNHHQEKKYDSLVSDVGLIAQSNQNANREIIMKIDALRKSTDDQFSQVRGQIFELAKKGQ